MTVDERGKPIRGKPGAQDIPAANEETKVESKRTYTAKRKPQKFSSLQDLLKFKAEKERQLEEKVEQLVLDEHEGSRSSYTPIESEVAAKVASQKGISLLEAAALTIYENTAPKLRADFRKEDEAAKQASQTKFAFQDFTPNTPEVKRSKLDSAQAQVLKPKRSDNNLDLQSEAELYDDNSKIESFEGQSAQVASDMASQKGMSLLEAAALTVYENTVPKLRADFRKEDEAAKKLKNAESNNVDLQNSKTQHPASAEQIAANQLGAANLTSTSSVTATPVATLEPNQANAAEHTGVVADKSSTSVDPLTPLSVNHATPSAHLTNLDDAQSLNQLEVKPKTKTRGRSKKSDELVAKVDAQLKSEVEPQVASQDEAKTNVQSVQRGQNATLNTAKQDDSSEALYQAQQANVQEHTQLGAPSYADFKDNLTQKSEHESSMLAQQYGTFDQQTDELVNQDPVPRNKSEQVQAAWHTTAQMSAQAPVSAAPLAPAQDRMQGQESVLANTLAKIQSQESNQSEVQAQALASALAPKVKTKANVKDEDEPDDAQLAIERKQIQALKAMLNKAAGRAEDDNGRPQSQSQPQLQPPLANEHTEVRKTLPADDEIEKPSALDSEVTATNFHEQPTNMAQAEAEAHDKGQSQEQVQAKAPAQTQAGAPKPKRSLACLIMGTKPLLSGSSQDHADESLALSKFKAKFGSKLSKKNIAATPATSGTSAVESDNAKSADKLKSGSVGAGVGASLGLGSSAGANKADQAEEFKLVNKKPAWERNKRVLGLDIFSGKIQGCLDLLNPDKSVTETFSEFNVDPAGLEQLCQWIEQNQVSTVVFCTHNCDEWQGVYEHLEQHLPEVLLRVELWKDVYAPKLLSSASKALAQQVAVNTRLNKLEEMVVPNAECRKSREKLRHIHDDSPDISKMRRTLDGLVNRAHLELWSVFEDYLDPSFGQLVIKAWELQDDLYALEDYVYDNFADQADKIFKALESDLDNWYEALEELKNLYEKLLSQKNVKQQAVDEIKQGLSPEFKQRLANLASIPGVDEFAALVLLSEAGLDFHLRFSRDYFGAWATNTTYNSKAANKYVWDAFFACARRVTEDENNPFYGQYLKFMQKYEPDQALTQLMDALAGMCFTLNRNGQKYVVKKRFEGKRPSANASKRPPNKGPAKGRSGPAKWYSDPSNGHAKLSMVK